jgi:hypothetical protein
LALLLCAAGRSQANQEARGGSTTNWPILVVGRIVGNCPLSSGRLLLGHGRKLAAFDCSAPVTAKLFGLHAILALLLPAEDSEMRSEMGFVAVLLLLDVAKDREHAIGHRIY